MKCFILFLALSVLCSSVIGNFHLKNKNVKVNVRTRRNYGSSYGRVEIVKPVQNIALDTRVSGYGQQQVVQQPIAMDRPVVSSGYGQQVVQQPIAMDRPVVSSGYGQQIVQQPIAMDRPVVSSGYGQQEQHTTIALERPVVSSGYGQQIVQTTTAAPVIAMDRPVVSSGYGQQEQHTTIAMDRPVVSSGYGQTATIALDNTAELLLEPEYRNICLNRAQGSVFYLPHPTRQTFYIQCDEFGQAFLKECPANTIFTQNLVCEDVKNLLPIDKKPEMDQRIGSYGAAPQFSLDTTSNVQSHVEVIVEAPEFKHLCASRNAYGAQVSTVFYVAHPTKQSFYIQCDEFGRAFLKECPIGTIFTRNLVCERVGEIHTETVVEQPIVQQTVPQLDRTETSNYGQVVSAPVALDTPTQTRVEIIVEAPEFKSLCATRNAYGAATSSVFYVAHPTKQSFYIQCDEFGRAFLKECPANTVFTQNLVCENVNDLHTVERETIVQQALDQASVSSGTYGSVPKFSQDAVVSTQAQVELVVEAPEFKELCLSKNAYGAATSTVFYVAHPTDRRKYIQCNEFGNAYLKECPLNTVFTSNLVCELL